MNEQKIRSQIGYVLRWTLVIGTYIVVFWGCHVRIGKFEAWGPGGKPDTGWTKSGSDITRSCCKLPLGTPDQFMSDTIRYSQYCRDTLHKNAMVVGAYLTSPGIYKLSCGHQISEARFDSVLNNIINK